MIIKNFYTLVGICFFASPVFLIGACSTSNSSAQTTNQNVAVPSIVRVDRLKPDLNGRVYKSKTTVLNNELLRNLDCNNPGGYDLVAVKNHYEDEGIPSLDLNIVVVGEPVVKIELPTGFETKNFSLSSAKKNRDGFQMNTNWGGGLYHYEIKFSFRCQRSNFYLYKVQKDSFSTTNSDNGYWDKKKTEEAKIEPNLPIEKFIISDYL
jgi:hypothetical protein